jgi:ornithine cyclodeaminase
VRESEGWSVAEVEMKIVSEEELREAVGEAEALAAVETAFRALAEGRATQPSPMGMEVVGAQGEIHVKGAHLQGEPVFAIKVASGFYRNPHKGLPTGAGLVLVFDAETGFPLALLQDNGFLTELRTGAAGALAVRLLTPERLLNVGVVGTGSQARYQLRAMARVRGLSGVRAWSPAMEEISPFRREMEAELGLEVEAVRSVEEAVLGADLVVTVTPSRRPLVRAEWLKPDATVIAVGADGPEKQELAVEVLGRAGKVVVDSLPQCLRLGEVHHAVAAGLITPDGIHGELGAVLVGQVPGREGGELIVCDLTGVGVQDAAMAGEVWRRLGH